MIIDFRYAEHYDYTDGAEQRLSGYEFIAVAVIFVRIGIARRKKHNETYCEKYQHKG